MNIKAYIGLALILLVVTFILQNTTVVDIQLLFWKISISRSLMIFFVLTIGIIIAGLLQGTSTENTSTPNNTRKH